jgi:hypothetical protein
MQSDSDAASTLLDSVFTEVLAQAGQREDRFFLVVLPGRPAPNGRHAAFYQPGPIDEDPADILHGAQLAHANTPEVVDRHRIAAFASINWDEPLQEAALAGRLRHEVRHAEQYDELGQTFFDLYDIAELVCQWKVGGLPRGGILYGLIPAEMDANGAAASFLRERRSEAIDDVLNSDYNVLARSNTPPGPLNELPTKMVAFLYLMREVADDPVRSSGISFEKRLRHVSGRAAATWAALVAG